MASLQRDLGRAEFVRADIRNPLIAKVIGSAQVDTVVLSMYRTPRDELAGELRSLSIDVRVIGEKLDQLESIVTRVLNFAKAPASLHSRWALADIIADTLVLVMRVYFEKPRTSTGWKGFVNDPTA